MERLKLAIVIPAFNEEKTIKNVVKSLKQYGEPIVVDDGSSDKTRAIALDAGAKVISHNKNMGYDKALNSGFKKAFSLDFDAVITLDADGQHDSSVIPKFCNKIILGNDVVVGIRNKKQRFSEHLFAFYTKLRFKIDDPLCGMKAYSRSAYESLGYFDSYNSIGTELMIYAIKNNFSLGQVPLITKNRIDKTRFGGIISSNLKIIKAMILSIC